MSHKAVSHDYLTRLSHWNVSQGCLTWLSYRTISQGSLITWLHMWHGYLECWALSHDYCFLGLITGLSLRTTSHEFFTGLFHRAVSITGLSHRTSDRAVSITGLSYRTRDKAVSITGLSHRTSDKAVSITGLSHRTSDKAVSIITKHN